jgi:hypothetical protein
MKSSQRLITAMITAFAGIGIITYFMVVVFRDDKWKALAGAVVMAYEIIPLGLVSVVLLLFRRTRQIGEGMLIGTGITLVIGFGICSSV